MCSGCSGSYAGDYESPDDEFMEDKQSLGLYTGNTRNANAEPHGSELPLSAHLSDSCPIGLRHSSDFLPVSPTVRPAPAVEHDWEVLVSDQQIIEIHCLHASPVDPTESWDSRHANVAAAQQSQHSPQRSAKYYETQVEAVFFKRRPSPIWLLVCGLGAITAATLALCLLLG